MQTTIEAEGFRSLREGEEVEFVIEPSEDNRFKAVKVTGPDGAPPQVQQDDTHHKTVKPVQLSKAQTASESMPAMYTNNYLPNAQLCIPSVSATILQCPTVQIIYIAAL